MLVHRYKSSVSPWVHTTVTRLMDTGHIPVVSRAAMHRAKTTYMVRDHAMWPAVAYAHNTFGQIMRALNALGDEFPFPYFQHIRARSDYDLQYKPNMLYTIKHDGTRGFILHLSTQTYLLHLQHGISELATALPLQLAPALLDAEIMDDGTVWAIDVLLLGGVDMRQQPMRERVARLDKLRAYLPRVATYHDLTPEDHDRLLRDVDVHLAPHTDGFILVDANGLYKKGALNYKLKPLCMQTIDCIVKNKQVWVVGQDGILAPLDIDMDPDIVEQAARHPPQAVHELCVAGQDDQDVHLEYVRVRRDKTAPNAKYVAESVIAHYLARTTSKMGAKI